MEVLEVRLRMETPEGEEMLDNMVESRPNQIPALHQVDIIKVGGG